MWLFALLNSLLGHLHAIDLSLQRPYRTRYDVAAGQGICDEIWFNRARSVFFFIFLFRLIRFKMLPIVNAFSLKMLVLVNMWSQDL